MADYKRDSERFRRLFDETKDTADKLHRCYTEGANLTGYIRDRLMANNPFWFELVDYSPGDPEIDMTTASGEVFLGPYNQQPNQLCDQLPDPLVSLATLASSAATFDANTASLSDVIPIIEGKEIEHQSCPFINQGDYWSCANKLEKQF